MTSMSHMNVVTDICLPSLANSATPARHFLKQKIWLRLGQAKNLPKGRFSLRLSALLDSNQGPSRYKLDALTN